MPDLAVLLYIWKDLESKDVVNTWLSELKGDSKDFARLLGTFVGKSTVSDGRGTRVHHVVSRKTVEDFFPVIEELEPVLADLKCAELSHWERFAVEEILKRIDEKKRGIQEVDWRFHDEE